MQRQMGFTTTDTLVVIGATALLLSLIVPSTLQAVEGNTLRQAAVLVANELRHAQAAAMAESADYTVEFYDSAFTEGTGWMRVWKQGVATPTREIRPPRFPLSVQTLDSDGSFNSCGSPADPANICVIFKPLGFPTQGGNIRLRSTRTYAEYKVVVAPATGRVSIAR